MPGICIDTASGADFIHGALEGAVLVEYEVESGEDEIVHPYRVRPYDSVLVFEADSVAAVALASLEREVSCHAAELIRGQLLDLHGLARRVA